MKSITLAPDLKELYTLNEFILSELEEQNLQVDLIVEEVFVNIVNYSKTEFITVYVENSNDTLKLEFIDNGIEFNPLLKEDPEIKEKVEENKIGGLGIFLTRQTADELYYDYMNGENHLKIIKKLE